ncbi:hypothetical protein AU476_03785 [Cupriavidus sp. UYMSc13B]|nr:hypothetical protein AU476_03785 [Cupriavidus sp. UYMSc13B]
MQLRLVQVDDELVELSEGLGLFGTGLSFEVPAQDFHSLQLWLGAVGPMQRVDQCRVARVVAVCGRPLIIICSRFCTRMAIW